MQTHRNRSSSPCLSVRAEFPAVPSFILFCYRFLFAALLSINILSYEDVHLISPNRTKEWKIYKRVCVFVLHTHTLKKAIAMERDNRRLRENRKRRKLKASFQKILHAFMYDPFYEIFLHSSYDILLPPIHPFPSFSFDLISVFGYGYKAFSILYVSKIKARSSPARSSSRASYVRCAHILQLANTYC